MRSILFTVVLLIGLSKEYSFAATGDSILFMEERAKTVDRLLSVRLRDLPAKLMRREGLDTVSYTHLTLPTKRIV